MTLLCPHFASSEETEPGGEADTATLLGRLRHELVGLSTLVLNMQELLGPTLSQAAHDVDVLHGSQDLDLVAQSLQGLSDFLGVVERRADADRFDVSAAAAVVKLAGLAARLAGQDPATAVDAGEPELF